MVLSKKKILLWVGVIIVSFVVGIFFATLIREKAYEIKKWIVKPSPPPRTRMVKLYFSLAQGEYLVPQQRKIFLPESDNEENKEMKVVLEELIKGPKNKDLFSTIPPDTRVRAVYIKDEIIYVDFSSSLKEKHPGGTIGELLTVYSIVDTLLDNFPSYSRVQILVQGEPQTTLVGHIDIRHPLPRNSEIIKSFSE
ncbi:GerMN domain-containing protein [Patescibacteria group bacterium]|nr:GerMN domain-containing protein [Patescibacteria group bacterium]